MLDKQWHKEQIEKYNQVYPVYEIYAETLEKILKVAGNNYAPLCIVQARAKAISSFAEKAIRKAHKYDDPVHQLTDLCGARIITHTQEQVKNVCRFIRDNFLIDEANSLDVSSRLSISEFGYLSFHYIVTPIEDQILGIPIPEEIKDKKAEIQVRTLLQHTWADILHDRIYKTPIKVPQFWMREAGRLAAIMENADKGFAEMAGTLDALTANYGTLLSKEQLETEIEMARVILENDPKQNNKPKHALKLAYLLKNTASWDEIISVLEPFINIESEMQKEIILEAGNAYCAKYKQRPKSDSFNKGIEYISNIAVNGKIDNANWQEILTNEESELKKQRAKALSLLADAYYLQTDNERKSRDLLFRAYQLNPDNPYLFSSFLEFEVAVQGNTNFIAAMRPLLYQAIETCRTHIRVGLELPFAYFAIGKFYLLLEEPYRGLSAIAKAIDLYLSKEVNISEDIVDREIEAFTRMNVKRSIDDFKNIITLIHLAKAIKHGNAFGLEKSDKRRISKPFKEPVLIVAGGADKLPAVDFTEYSKYILEGIKSFSGTIISGGTKSGIPSIVCSMSELAAHQGNDQFELFGYVPAGKHEQIDQTKRDYRKLIKSNGRHFSYLEAIFYWYDLISAGVNPKNVRLLGINGGRISGAEYRLALALGASVGVLESSGRAVADLINDQDWTGHERLWILPRDAKTVWAFMNPERNPSLTEQQIDEAARIVHDNYRESQKKKIAELSLLEWDDLRDDFKNSNRQQVEYMEEILHQAGFGLVEKDKEKIKIYKFSDDEIEFMAEFEHARWNVERLQSGWKYGPRKDAEKKISPYLVPWSKVPDDIKEYDRDAMRNMPKILAEAGFEVYNQKKNV